MRNCCYEWFIDDNIQAGQNGSTFTHSFNSGGNYNIGLIVTTNDGCRAKSDQDIEVLPAPSATLPDVLANACVRESIAFAASNTNSNTTTDIVTWLWEFGDGNTSNEEHPFYAYEASGTYEISLTLTNILGCETTIMSNVSIYESAITECEITPSGTIDICTADLPLVLTAPTSDNGVYNWSNGATTPTIEVNSSGRYFVTIYDTNGCACISSPVQINVTSPPSAIIRGDLEICAGESTTLDATVYDSNNNYNYNWSHSNLNTETITVHTSGTYSVTITNTTTNCQNIASVEVVRSFPPNHFNINTNPTPACEGVTTTLSVNNPDPTLTYLWNTGEVGTSITVSTVGVYNVTANNDAGCQRTSTVEVHPLPDVCMIPSGCYERCIGDELCISEDFSTYQWYLNNEAIVGATSSCITFDASGIYQVAVGSNQGCTAFSDELEITTSSCAEMTCDSLAVTATATSSPDDYCCYDIALTNDIPDWVTSVQFVPLNSGAFEFSNIMNPDNSQWFYTSISDDKIEVISNTGNEDPTCYYLYFPTGTQEVVQFCLENYSTQPQQVLVNWKNCADVICTDTLTFDCNRCVNVTNESLVCDENKQFTYTFDVQNVFNQDLCQLGVNIVETDNPDITIVPDPLTFDPCLQVGETATAQSFIFENAVEGDTVKIVLESSAFLNNEEEFTKSINSCISDTICLVMPECPCHACNDIVYDWKSIEIGVDTCCFSMDFELCTDEYTGVKLTSLNGVFFTNLETEENGGWYFTGVDNTSTSTWHPVPGPPHNTNIEAGMYEGKVQFCLGGYESPDQFPQDVVIEWLSGDDTTIGCQDTMQFYCQVPTPDSCAAITEEVWECLPDGSYSFGFSITNISDFTADQLSIINISASTILGDNIPLPSIFREVTLSPDGTITVDPIILPSLINAGDELCFQVGIAENYEMTDYFIRCCHTDTLCFTVPSCEPDCALDVNLLHSSTICVGDNHTIISNITGAIGDVTCSWETSHPTLISSDCNLPFTPLEAGEYTFTLTVTDEAGCEAKDETIIVVEDCCCPDQEQVDSLANQGFLPYLDANNCNTIIVEPTADIDLNCYEIEWIWGDDSPNTTSMGNNSVDHTYPREYKRYQVCMIIRAKDTEGNVCAEAKAYEQAIVDCGRSLCSCENTFSLAVGDGFSSEAEVPCKYTFTPNSLNSECDKIRWEIFEKSSLVHSDSGYSISYDLTNINTYLVCMYVERTTPSGESCYSEICQKVEGGCVGINGGNGDNVINNNSFINNSVGGIMNINGSAAPWQAPTGTPTIMEGEGCDDDNYLQLKGNRERSDIISQAVENVAADYYTISYCYRMVDNNLATDTETRLIARLSNGLPNSNLCTVDCQVMGKSKLKNVDTWTRVTQRATRVDNVEGTAFVSLHIENDLVDDGTVLTQSIVEIDNISIIPAGDDCDDIQIDIMDEGYILAGPGLYKAKERIVSDITLGYGSDIRFTAGESIYLGAGFTVPEGAVFTATAKDCEENLIPNEEEVSDRNDDLFILDNQSLDNLQLTTNPNPFKDKTTITYHLPTNGFAYLQVLDINGSVVHTLQNRQYQTAGQYKVELVKNNLPEGLYFIRLQTEQNALTKKLILTR